MIWNSPHIPTSVLLSNPYVFTTVQTVRRNALGTTTQNGYAVENTTAATSSVQQVSPAFTRTGRGWKTNSTGSSQTVSFRDFVLPVSWAAAPTGVLKFQSSINGASFSDVFTIDSAWNIVSTGKATFNDVAKVSKIWNNYLPGTTDHLNLQNPGGSYTHIAFEFASSVIKSSITAKSDGTIQFKNTGAGQIEFHGWNSNIWSVYQISYIGSSGFWTSQNVVAGWYMSAWQVSQGHSIMHINGSQWHKWRYITQSTTLGLYDYIALVNTADAEACVWTPSTTSCSGYNSWNCTSHAGCSWTSINCPDYNGNQSGCESSPGCSWETASCSGFGDEWTCNGYGGCSWTYETLGCDWFGNEMDCTGHSGCSWNPESTSSCSGFGDESTCNSYSGCSWTITPYNCSEYFFDESSCNAQSGCSWNGSSCDGTFNVDTCEWSYVSSPANCSGSYNNYYCSGTYVTGNCVGTGWYCWGTVTCSWYGSQSPCEAETGCNWETGVTIDLPNIDSVIDGNNVWRPYFIQKIDNSAWTLLVSPYSWQTIEWASNISTTTQYASWLLYPFKATENCNIFETSGACGAASWCAWTYYECSSFSNSEDCSAQSGCSWDWSFCTGQYGWYCSGTHIISKQWHKMLVRS